MSWPTTVLGDVVEFLDHKRRPITSTDRVSGPYPYFGANGQQDSVADYLFDERLVLIAEDGGHFDDPGRGIAYRVEGKCWVNNHAHVLRPRAVVDWAFLARVLENADVSRHISGTTRAKLTKAGAAAIEIPLPPIEEQRRIAAVLDAADALRSKRREALAKLDTLTRAIFVDVFGEPSVNPNSYTTIPMIDIVDPDRPITYGILKPGENVADGVPYVRVLDMIDGSIAAAGLRRTTVEISDQYRRSLLKVGDLLLSIRGHVGRLAMVGADVAGSNITQDTARLAISEANSAFVLEYLRTEACQRWMATFTKGAAVRGLNLTDLKRLPVLIPPRDAQDRFAVVVARTASARASIQVSLERLDLLCASLHQRAFRGEL